MGGLKQCSGVALKHAFSPGSFNYIINWIVCQTLQGYTGVQVGTSIQVPDPTYADDVVHLIEIYVVQLNTTPPHLAAH